MLAVLKHIAKTIAMLYPPFRRHFQRQSNTISELASRNAQLRSAGDELKSMQDKYAMLKAFSDQKTRQREELKSRCQAFLMEATKVARVTGGTRREFDHFVSRRGQSRRETQSTIGTGRAYQEQSARLTQEQPTRAATDLNGSIDDSLSVSIQQRALHQSSDDLVLLFPHIPKTAGTTFLRILDDVYAHKNQFSVFRGSNNNAVNDFARLDDERKKCYSVVRGHMNFGLHKFVKAPWAYVTFLRNPNDRVISHYYWIQRNRAHWLHEACKSMSLNDFLDSRITTEIDNGQTRVMAGIANVPPILLPFDDDVKQVPFGACDEATFSTAKENLERCVVAGLVEEFDASLILMKRVLNWQSIPLYSKLNVDSQAEEREQIDDATYDRLIQVNEWDMKLWNYCRKLLCDRIEEQGLPFWTELEYFTVANTLYQGLQAIGSNLD